jgi:cyclohexyl-isocyanide hydratase
MLLFPQLTQLDLTGPHEVLARLPGAQVALVAASRDPVTSETGLAIVPTATFAEVPAVDILFVPGGWGQVAAGDDPATVAWLAQVGATARWVTSACTGALLLGMAGLLDGYRATTHWAFHDLLPLVGAIPAHERVVIDRNRITGGGVTAGIDFALTLVAHLIDRKTAEATQLRLEYNPAPPFGAGSPETAPSEVLARVNERIAPFKARRAEAVARAAARLAAQASL